MNIYICIYIYILFPISAKVLESFSLRFTELSKCNRHPPTSYKRGECVCVCVCVPAQPCSAVSARIFWAVAPVVVSRPQVFLLVVR